MNEAFEPRASAGFDAYAAAVQPCTLAGPRVTQACPPASSATLAHD